MAANKISTLTILLRNANGISNNTNKLQIALKENSVDISLITESHLTFNSKFKIFGYDCLQANHPDDSPHAGAALLISSKIPHSPFPPKSNQNMKLAATSANINSIPTSIISAYFHPGCQFPAESLALHLQSLNNTYIIGADFNAKHEAEGCRSTNMRGRTLLNFITNKCSKIISPASPTYWPTNANRHPDFLEFFLSNLPNHIDTNITNLNDPASDHTPVILKIQASIDFNQLIKIRIDWNKFRITMSTFSSLNLNLKTQKIFDNTVYILKKNIQDTIQTSSTTHPTQDNHNINTTSEIRELIWLKRRARNIWQRTHYSVDKQRYSYYSNKLKSSLREAQKSLICNPYPISLSLKWIAVEKN